MMKKKIVALAAVMMASLSMMSGTTVAAVPCPTGSMHAGSEKPSIAECNIPADPSGDVKLMDRVKIIINVILGIIGLVAVVMMIIGGISFVTSQGDAGKVAKARNTILYGVVGLIIALLAFAIVNFVLTSVFTSATPKQSS